MAIIRLIKRSDLANKLDPPSSAPELSALNGPIHPPAEAAALGTWHRVPTFLLDTDMAQAGLIDYRFLGNIRSSFAFVTPIAQHPQV